jgi:hypothetical protein
MTKKTLKGWITADVCRYFESGFAVARQFSADMRSPKQPEAAICVPIRIDVGKSAYHQLSQSEIASDNPCSQHLFGK